MNNNDKNNNNNNNYNNTHKQVKLMHLYSFKINQHLGHIDKQFMLKTFDPWIYPTANNYLYEFTKLTA